MALDFLAGCLGGCAGVIVGHPLDTVKVILQTQDVRSPKYHGSLDCLRSLLVKEGIRGIYKGMSSPLMGVTAVNAIVFGIYGNTQKSLNQDSLYSHCFAGAAAGFCQSFFCSPMELVKSRLQVVTQGTISGPMDCLRHIYNQEGFRGVFRGLSITICREVPAFSSYFVTYEWLTKSRNSETVSTSKMIISGGLAGVISWIVVYPVDVIKSRMQIDGLLEPVKYHNIYDCFKKSLRSDGYQFLFRGLTPTIFRAFPVNAATFTVVTWTLRLFDDHNHNKDVGSSTLWGKCTDVATAYTLNVSNETTATV